MEIVPNLPEELKWKVFSYLSHPVADIMRNVHVEKLNWMKIYLKQLQKYFPEMTYDDLCPYYQGANAEYMTWYEELYECLYHSTYKEAFNLFFHKCAADFQTVGKKLTPLRFYWACHFLQQQFPAMFKHYTPDMTAQWITHDLHITVVGGAY